MRRRPTCLVLFSATIAAAAALYHPGSASATTAAGYKSTLLAVGRFGEMVVSNSFPQGAKAGGNAQLWLSLQETKGSSDIYVQRNVWAPGGSSNRPLGGGRPRGRGLLAGRFDASVFGLDDCCDIV